MVTHADLVLCAVTTVTPSSIAAIVFHSEYTEKGNLGI